MLGTVEQLKSAVDSVLAVLESVEDDDVIRAEAAEALLGLAREQERLDAAVGGFVSDLEARGFHEGDAAYSMANWLVARTGQSRNRAGSRVHLARKLRSMPATLDALRAGVITACHARVLGRALNARTTEVFARDEAMLVEQATKLTADQLAQAIGFWLRYADQDGPAPRVEGEDDRFWMSETMDGRLKGTFDLGGSLAITVKRALDEYVDRLLRQDKANRDVDPSDPGLDQTPAQRRARALGELCDHAAASDKNPAKRQPLFTIHTTIDTVCGRGNPDDWLLQIEQAWTAAIPAFETRLWACDCWMSEIVIRKTDGEPLDAGRELRIANRAMRRALVARDGNCCAVPGCDRPVGWCDAHHIWHWEDGGPTNLDNLVFVCRWHHRRIHTDELRVEMTNDRPQFTNRAGMILTEPERNPAFAGEPPSQPPGDPPKVHAA